jgi:hypothetical protein
MPSAKLTSCWYLCPQSLQSLCLNLFLPNKKARCCGLCFGLRLPQVVFSR